MKNRYIIAICFGLNIIVIFTIVLKLAPKYFPKNRASLNLLESGIQDIGNAISREGPRNGMIPGSSPNPSSPFGTANESKLTSTNASNLTDNIKDWLNEANGFNEFPEKIGSVLVVEAINGLFPNLVWKAFPNSPRCFNVNFSSIMKRGENPDSLKNPLKIPGSYPNDSLAEAFSKNHRHSYQVLGKKLREKSPLMLPDLGDIKDTLGICLINHAIIDENGRICGVSNTPPHNAVCLRQSDCSNQAMDRKILADSKMKLPIHDYVAVISEYWGNGFFHFFLENLPRMVGIADLLRKHPSIQVHVPIKNQMITSVMGALGIEENRLVSGRIRARKIIVPENVNCGSPSFMHVRGLREILMESLDKCNLTSGPNLSEKIITVVFRSGRSRSIKNHKELIATLESEFRSAGYEVRDFAPSKAGRCGGIMSDLDLFRRSRAIVAPHGAGLSNLLACKPGTVVIEIQTRDFNACYVSLSLKLDLDYIYFSDQNASHDSSIVADIPSIVRQLKGRLQVL